MSKYQLGIIDRLDKVLVLSLVHNTARRFQLASLDVGVPRFNLN